MGNHTLIVVSHDSFGEQDSAWIGALSDYVRNADSRSAEILKQVSHGSVVAISTRHHTEPFYVSNKVDGFPTQLPYDEALDEENKAWEAAQTKARAYLGKSLKLRTVAQLRDLIVRLITKNKVVDAAIKAADGAFFARRKLENTSWQPTRADYEALKNRLASIAELLEQPE